METRSNNILKYLIEFLIVAFGVFLGIYVSDWQEQKKVNIEKEKSIQYILEEIETNKTNLKHTIKYHETIKVGFDSLVNTLTQEEVLTPYLNSPLFNHQNITGWAGVGLPSFEDIAFEGAKISGIIQEIDIETIQDISKAYKLQNFVSEIGKSALDKLIDINSSSKIIDAITILDLLLSDFLNMERALLNQYTETIDRLQSDS